MGRVFSLCLTGLIGVGVLRPVLPEMFRSHWVLLVVVLAAFAAAARFVHARARHDYEGYLIALLPLALALVYLQPQRVASDGIFYYTPLHSIVVDGDLDFENEYRVLGAQSGYFQRTVTGRLPNNFSVGPALVWTPFFLAAHLLAHLGLFRPTGFGYPYFTAIATGTALVGFLGVVLTFRLVRCYHRAPVALAATVFVWLASFHIWYMVFEPSMSHAMAMTSVAAFFLVHHLGVRGKASYLLMGAMGGVVALMRWQNVLFLPVALALSWARYGRPKVGELALGAAAFVVVFSPQLLYWSALYGSPLLVPQGGGYIDWSSPELEAVLFSSRHGLLSWAPLLWLGLLGLPGFIRRAPVFGAASAIAIALAWYVNASVFDWWAGASFGSRRFDAALPVLTLGVAVTLEWMARHARRRPLATVCLVLTPFLLWNAALMGVYFGGGIAPDGPASFRQAASDGLELIYSRIGYPPSWPAAIGRGQPVSIYDLDGAQSLANNVDIRMGDTDALYLGHGWSLPRRGRERTTRTVAAASATLYVALVEASPYVITVDGRSGAQGEMILNGASLGIAAIDRSGQASVAVAASAIVSGINTLTFINGPGNPLEISRVRWVRPGG